jgi:hypothetical protein
MAATFPCPNPACTYHFDTAQLPAAAMVTCPVCHTRFPYRASNRPARTAPVPPPPHQAPRPPYVPPDAPYQPSYGPAAPPASAAEPEPEAPRLVRPHYMPRRSGLQTWLLLGGFTAFVIVGLFVLYNTVRNRPWSRGGGSAGPHVEELYNYSQQIPDDWKTDADARNGLAVNTFALKKTGEDAWVALFVQDYKDRNPRPAELAATMKSKLRDYFGGPDKIEIGEPSQTTWAKQPAALYVFTGEVDGALMRGECHLMAYKGIAYLFFAWAPADKFDARHGDLDAMRERFQLLDKREQWTETRSNRVVFTPPEGDYQIEDTEGVWKDRRPREGDPKSDRYAVDPKEIDPQATMALRAVFPVKTPAGKSVDFPPEAEAIVLVLDKADGDPLQAAREKVLSRFKEEDKITETETTLEEAGDSPMPTPVPEGGAPVARFQSKNNRDGSQVWFYVVSALPMDGKLVVVETKCRNSPRRRDAQYMEPYMVKLAASLKRRE